MQQLPATSAPVQVAAMLQPTQNPFSQVVAMEPSVSGRRGPPSWTGVGPKINCGKRRPTPAQRVEHLLGLLVDIVRTEWKTIRALNLGM